MGADNDKTPWAVKARRRALPSVNWLRNTPARKRLAALLFDYRLVRFTFDMGVKVSPIPTHIRRLGKHGVEILWRDGHRSEYTNHHLRHHCPCASCRERPSRALPVVGAGTEELYPARLDVVGRYAISIQWTDGHDTGIYSYRTLRQICPCERCAPPPRVDPDGAAKAAAKVIVP